MRRLLAILTVCVTGILGFASGDGAGSVRTGSSSAYLDITVSSNIGKQLFQYDINPMCLSFPGKQKPGFRPGRSVNSIMIPVKEFKCTNKSAYKDLLTLLKAEQYPILEIDVPHNLEIEFNSADTVIIQSVFINVAGVSKRYDINCKISNVSHEVQLLNGTARLKLTDLEIVPPVRLLGLVKVHDEIIIDFAFCLKY